MLGNSLGSDGIPTFVVDFNPPVKFAEEIISVFVEFVQGFVTRNMIVIQVVIPLGSLVSIVVIRVINKLFDSSLKYHNIFLLILLVSVHEYIYPIYIEVFNRKWLLLLLRVSGLSLMVIILFFSSSSVFLFPWFLMTVIHHLVRVLQMLFDCVEQVPLSLVVKMETPRSLPLLGGTLLI